MSQILEFISNHPYLVGSAVVLTALVVVTEVRARRTAGVALGASDAVRLINSGAMVVDLRPSEQFKAGHLASAVSIPADEFTEQKLKQGRSVLLCCDTGVKSLALARQLRGQGHEAFSLKGGIEAWKRDHLPLVD